MVALRAKLEAAESAAVSAAEQREQLAEKAVWLAAELERARTALAAAHDARCLLDRSLASLKEEAARRVEAAAVAHEELVRPSVVVLFPSSSASSFFFFAVLINFLLSLWSMYCFVYCISPSLPGGSAIRG